MYDTFEIFESSGAEAVLLVDAGHTFNSLNKLELITSIKYICPSLATFVGNWYNIPVKLLVLRRKEIRSIGNYGIGLKPLLNLLVSYHPEKYPRLVAFAYGLTCAGSIVKLAVGGQKFWKLTQNLGTFRNQQRQD